MTGSPFHPESNSCAVSSAVKIINIYFLNVQQHNLNQINVFWCIVIHFFERRSANVRAFDWFTIWYITAKYKWTIERKIQ